MKVGDCILGTIAHDPYTYILSHLDAKKEAAAAAAVAATNQSTQSSKEPSKDKDQCDVDLITKSLTSLLEEDDDSVFPNELPLQVRSAFENVRQKWSDKLDSIKEDKKRMEQAHNGKNTSMWSDMEILTIFKRSSTTTYKESTWCITGQGSMDE